MQDLLHTYGNFLMKFVQVVCFKQFFFCCTKRTEISSCLSSLPEHNKTASSASLKANPLRYLYIQRRKRDPEKKNHVLHLHPAQILPPPRSAAVLTSACSRHHSTPSPSSAAAASPPAPLERHELCRVQAVAHRRCHRRRGRRGRGVE